MHFDLWSNMVVHKFAYLPLQNIKTDPNNKCHHHWCHCHDFLKYICTCVKYENTNWSSQYKRATTQLVHLKSQLNVWEYPCAQMSSWTWSVSDSTYIWQRQTIKSGKVKIKPPGPKNWQNYRFRVTNGKNWTEGCDCDNTLQLFCVCLLMKSYWNGLI